MGKRKKKRMGGGIEQKIKQVFASARSLAIQNEKPVTLPKLNILTLEEIEKKYGKL